MPAPEPVHLKPAAPLAERVLLPGDPQRALAVAQALLERPRIFNHQRGLWGYTGDAPGGEPVTVQATGMGGPSAAIVVSELLDLGAERLVRIGTCGSLGRPRLGDLVAAVEVMPADGTSAALGAPPKLVPDEAQTKGLLAAGAAPARVVSTDLFYDERLGVVERWTDVGADVVEMEAATVLRLAALRGARAACLLAVTDLVGPPRRRLPADEVESLGVRLGEIGLAALTT